jgi:hypothetical protein
VEEVAVVAGFGDRSVGRVTAFFLAHSLGSGGNMAQKKQSPDRTLLLVKQRIFNKLCTRYRHSRQDSTFSIQADVLRRELLVSEDIFAEALDAFTHEENQLAIEVFERDGERCLRLGESARDICNDWSPARRPASKPEAVPKISTRNLFPSSA